MTDKKVWFITGAGRGMGVDFAKAPWRPVTRSSLPRNPARSPRPGRTTTCWPSSSTSPTPPTQRRLSRLRSTVRRIECWSTTPATSTPASSRSSAWRSSGRRLRPTSSARSTSPARRSGDARAALGLVITISSTAGSWARVLHRLRRVEFAVEGWMESLRPEVARSASARCRRARVLPHRAAHAGSTISPSSSIEAMPSAPSRPSPPGRHERPAGR